MACISSAENGPTPVWVKTVARPRAKQVLIANPGFANRRRFGEGRTLPGRRAATGERGGRDSIGKGTLRGFRRERRGRVALFPAAPRRRGIIAGLANAASAQPPWSSETAESSRRRPEIRPKNLARRARCPVVWTLAAHSSKCCIQTCSNLVRPVNVRWRKVARIVSSREWVAIMIGCFFARQGREPPRRILPGKSLGATFACV